MKFLQSGKDGGPQSPVTGYWLVEIKSLFSIVLLHFGKGTREAFHSHAFNALTLWLKGTVREDVYVASVTSKNWEAGQVKYTPRSLMHKIFTRDGAWALSFRGPWKDTWEEYSTETLKFTTLRSPGRQVVLEEVQP